LEKIDLNGQHFYYKATYPVSDLNDRVEGTNTLPPPAIRRIMLTYIELDLNTLKYIMTLNSVRHLTIKPSSAHATNRIESSDNGLKDEERVLDQFEAYCEGLDVVDVKLKQINVSAIYKKTESDTLLSRQVRVDEERSSSSDSFEEQNSDESLKMYLGYK
jgi:hypothetical protein